MAPRPRPLHPRVSRTAGFLCAATTFVLFCATSSVVLGAAANAATSNGLPALGPGLSLLERQYLFGDELAPARLLDEAAKSITRDIRDVSARKDDDGAWTWSTPDCELRVALPSEATVRSLETPLADIGRFLSSCSRRLPPRMPEMDSYLLNSVLSGLDPYSAVFDEKRQTEHNIQFQGKLAGIGAKVGTRKDTLVLLTVYPDSPAARAGLQDNDEVLRIDDLSTRNIPVGDAVERIRGDEGTKVNLLIRRKGEPEPRIVVVTRGIVVIPSVTSKMLPGEVLYTEITQFSQTTPDDFRHNVQKFVDDRDLAGVIIDLRNNSGGSMMGSSAIGDLFLTEGLLITTAGRDGLPARGLTTEVRASGNAPFADLPVIFLTAPVTASGSELLAASLRNNNRALLVGEHTFGKGTVQKTFPLHDTSTMKMTVGHFLPDGQPIPGGGLVPDIEVVSFRVGKGRLSIPLPAHRSDLPFWLRRPKWSNTEAAVAAYRLAFAEEFSEEDAKKEEDRENGEAEEPVEPVADGARDPDKPDRALEIAAAILRNHGDVSASGMLGDAQEFLERAVETSEADLGDFMYGHGLDWTDGSRPNGAADFTFEVVPTSTMRAGEETEVDIRLTNRSGAPFYRVRGILDSTGGAFDGRAVAFGRIEPGATRSWRMRIKTPGSARTGRVRVEAVLFDDDGELTKVKPVRLVVQEAPRPHLAFRTRIRPEPDDPTRLAIDVDISNRGEGPAEKVLIRLMHPAEEQFEILEGSGEVEELAPGSTHSFALRARLLGSFAEIPKADLYISENRHGIFLEPKIPLTASPEGEVAWSEPPRIRVDGFTDAAGGGYELLVSAGDDRSLTEVRARIDDDTVAYVEPQGDNPRSARLHLDWNPADDVKRLRVEAVDDEGLKDFYSGGL